MKIDIKNLGTIKKGSFETNKLTIIFGKNNSGKTYLSYTTYIIYKQLSDIIGQIGNISDLDFITNYSQPNLEKKLENVIFNIEGSISKLIFNFQDRIKEELSKGFKMSSSFFRETDVSIDLQNITSKAYENEVKFEAKDIFGLKHVIISKDKRSWDVNATVIKSANEESKRSFFREIDDSTKKIMSGLFKREIQKKLLTSIIELDNDDIFIVTSERTGIELFLKEIDSSRSRLAEDFSIEKKLQKLNKRALLSIIDESVSTYSLPISDNIKAIRSGSNGGRNNFKMNENFHHIIDSLRKISGGTFKRNTSGDTTFMSEKAKEIPLRMASSSIKSISLIDLYINEISSSGDILIIDEPELNLHPDNQIKMAELIARMVNSSIRVILTTHSDYLVREINNRIRLETIYKRSQEKAMEHVELDIDIIKNTDVNVFNINEDGFIEKINVSSNGIESVIFDDVISQSYEREVNISMDLNDD